MLECLFIMYFAHFLGDYTFQIGKVAKMKCFSYYYTFLHCIIYATVHYVCIFYIGISLPTLLLASLISLSHGIVDFVKAYISINKEKLKEKIYNPLLNFKFIYIFDQLTHYAFTFLFCYLIAPFVDMNNMISSVDPRVYGILLYVLIMHQPLYINYCILFDDKHKIRNAFSKKDSSFKIWTILIALCYAYSDWALIVCMAIFGILPKSFKKDITFNILATNLVFIIATKMCIGFLILL